MKYGSVSSTKIDMGDAGKNNQDTVNINSATITDTRITSHNGNDIFTIKEESYFDNVLLKTGEGNDTINVTGANLNRVDIDSGNGDLSKEPYGDTLEFISSAIRDSEIKSGNGNDTVDLGKGVSLDNSTITGSDGIDTLKIHDNSFNTTNAGKISGFEVLDMSGINADTKSIFHNASDIVNFIKNVGGESATSLTVKGVLGVGKFEDGTPEITTSREADGNPNTYKVTDGGQTFTLTIEDVNIIPSI